MGALRAAAAVALLANNASAHADPVVRWRPLIAEAASRVGLPPIWIERVMRAESAGLTILDGRPIRSSTGAMGLMQLMPATWATMRSRLGLGRDPDDPRDNILAGAFYLRLMHDRFGYPGLFAAYSMGPSGYAAHLAGRRPLPAETAAYLAKLTGTVALPTPANVSAPPPSLFAIRRDGVPAATSTRGQDIFVRRSDVD